MQEAQLALLVAGATLCLEKHSPRAVLQKLVLSVALVVLNLRWLPASAALYVCTPPPCRSLSSHCLACMQPWQHAGGTLLLQQLESALA